MAANKDHVRELYYLKRKMLPEHTRFDMDQKIMEAFFQTFDLSSITVLHSYLPMSTKIEVDTNPILNKIFRDCPHVRIAVPFTHISSRSLTHLVYRNDDTLIENRYGIPEPDPENSEVINVQEIDLVIVPLLAYDLKGHRVGYGAGYYDRFLSDCRDETKIVGVSHFGPEDQWIKSEEYDVDLDYCITSEKVYQF